MQRDLNQMASIEHDVLIIGGGINGAGVARDLALRGLRVALVEKSDFASGTSSTSTKLIHGGLRYLENFDLRLVFESCRERHTLQRIAPHLVQPLPFCIPVYRGDLRPLWMVRAGLMLYDLLALFRNTGTHHILSAAKAVAREPVLRPEGLRGAAVYWDCRMDDARLVLENILSATAAGALVANYAEVTGLLQRSGRVVGVKVQDRETGQAHELRAHLVINATGPWLDQLRRLDGDLEPVLRTTRGTHILVPRVNAGAEALYLSTGRDNRLFFVIPWGTDLSLIGTTDVDFTGDPDTIWPVEADIDYLLEEAARHLQGKVLRRECVVAAFAGLRPLVQDHRQKASRVSREHHLFTTAGGMISIAGGKYTTYRAVAEETARLACQRLGIDSGHSRTAQMALPGGDGLATVVRDRPEWQAHYGLDTAVADRLLQRYGARAVDALDLVEADRDLLQPVVPGSTLTRLEVAFSVLKEMARKPADVLRRRTSLALERGCGLKELSAVALQLQGLLAAEDRVRQQWVTDYRATEARIGEACDGD